MAGTVTIACKIPNGVILRTGAFKEVPTPVLGGGVRMERIWQADGKSIPLVGPAHHLGEYPKVQVTGGYGLNHNVDADLWLRWFEDNKESDLVVNQMVFAAVKKDAAEGMSAERHEIRSGLEPIVPNKDKRTKNLNKSLQVETDDSKTY